MSNKRQTAVEWLIVQVSKYCDDSYMPIDIYQQAKEMEKEQIMEAVNFGDGRGKIFTYSTAEQYYTETFNNLK